MEKAIREVITVEKLCKRFVLDRNERGLNPGTLADDRYVARRLVEAVGQTKAHELEAAQIRSFLKMASSDSNQRKFYKIGSLIFDFARENRFVMINPFAEIKRPKVDYTVPGILKPEEFRAMLNAAADADARNVLAFIALAGFAGLRRDELVKDYASDKVLDWSNINWEKRLITVPDDVAKQTTRKSGDRRFIPMEDALISWLEPIRKESGNVIGVSEAAFRRVFKAVCDKARVTPPTNALRHSFASYWLARSQKEGLGRLPVIMGNSEAVVRKLYLESLEPEDGFRWFSLRQSSSISASCRALDLASYADLSSAIRVA